MILLIHLAVAMPFFIVLLLLQWRWSLVLYAEVSYVCTTVVCCSVCSNWVCFCAWCTWVLSCRLASIFLLLFLQPLVLEKSTCPSPAMLPLVTRGKRTQTSRVARGSNRWKKKCFTKRRRWGVRKVAREEKQWNNDSNYCMWVRQRKTNKTCFHGVAFIPFDCCKVMMNCEPSTEGQQRSTVIVAGSVLLTASACL